MPIMERRLIINKLWAQIFSNQNKKGSKFSKQTEFLDFGRIPIFYVPCFGIFLKINAKITNANA